MSSACALAAWTRNKCVAAFNMATRDPRKHCLHEAAGISASLYGRAAKTSDLMIQSGLKGRGDNPAIVFVRCRGCALSVQDVWPLTSPPPPPRPLTPQPPTPVFTRCVCVCVCVRERVFVLAEVCFDCVPCFVMGYVLQSGEVARKRAHCYYY